jgi:hypothetical protein
MPRAKKEATKVPVLELEELEEFQPFIIGMREGYSRQNETVLGESFEYLHGKWNEQARQMSITVGQGRIKEMEPSKARKIIEEAKNTWYLRQYRHYIDKETAQSIRKLVRTPAGKRFFRRGQPTLDEKGRVVREWSCLADEIILEPLREYDGDEPSLVAAMRSEINRLKAENEELRSKEK